jgi:uncharacterized membrane protein
METSSKVNIDEATTDTNTSVDSSLSSDVEDSFSEEETKKAEEFKQKGNEAFKGNTHSIMSMMTRMQYHCFIFIIFHSISMNNKDYRCKFRLSIRLLQ